MLSGQYAIRVMLDICLNGDSEMLENVSDLDAQYEVEDTVIHHLYKTLQLCTILWPALISIVFHFVLFQQMFILLYVNRFYTSSIYKK